MLTTPYPSTAHIHDFAGQDAQHDQALRLVDAAFATYGYTSYATSVETFPPQVREALYRRLDRTARRVVHNPDRQYVAANQLSVDVEVKSEGGRYPNFAIDIDSHDAVLSCDGVYAFVDTGSGPILACWAKQVRVNTIWVPEQLPDFAAVMDRLRDEWPYAQPQPRQTRGGSQHPFILLPKDSPCLIDIEQFIELGLGT